MISYFLRLSIPSKFSYQYFKHFILLNISSLECKNIVKFTSNKLVKYEKLKLIKHSDCIVDYHITINCFSVNSFFISLEFIFSVGIGRWSNIIIAVELLSRQTLDRNSYSRWERTLRWNRYIQDLHIKWHEQ